jgi:hypothetical protein
MSLCCWSFGHVKSIITGSFGYCRRAKIFVGTIACCVVIVFGVANAKAVAEMKKST